jgi:hypothetical protein
MKTLKTPVKPKATKISKFGKAKGILQGKIYESPDCWDLQPFNK